MTKKRKPQKTWVYSPKKIKPKVPESEKELVQLKCNELIETEFKPKYIESPPTDHDFNYRVDILGKWHRSYFYFYSIFNCPSPRAMVPAFESKFARLEYTGSNCFNVAYMRHTGQWNEILEGLTLEECLSELRSNFLLQP